MKRKFPYTLTIIWGSTAVLVLILIAQQSKCYCYLCQTPELTLPINQMLLCSGCDDLWCDKQRCRGLQVVVRSVMWNSEKEEERWRIGHHWVITAFFSKLQLHCLLVCCPPASGERRSLQRRGEKPWTLLSRELDVALWNLVSLFLSSLRQAEIDRGEKANLIGVLPDCL